MVTLGGPLGAAFNIGGVTVPGDAASGNGETGFRVGDGQARRRHGAAFMA